MIECENALSETSLILLLRDLVKWGSHFAGVTYVVFVLTSSIALLFYLLFVDATE